MKNIQQIKTGNISEGIEFIQMTELEEETKEYIKKVYENTGYEAYPPDANTLNRSEGFKDGVKSDAARDYWYAQFQQEQKQDADVCKRFLEILKENQKASSELTEEDSKRSAQNIINETYEDLINIFEKTIKESASPK